MKKYKKIVLSLLLATMAMPLILQAGQRSLEETVKGNYFIFTAKITKAFPQDDSNGDGVKYNYSVANVEFLRGNKQAPINNVCFFSSRFKKDNSGKILGWTTPPLDSSGIEPGLKEGETYIFFSSYVNQDNLEIYRAEPIQKKDEIIQTIKDIVRELGFVQN